METASKQEYAGVKLTLDNCLIPEEIIASTPSSKDGLDATTEENLRLSGCECIQIAGIMLRLPQVAMATAQVLFQRFFFAKSFVKTKMEEAAMACIWLASKVEEAPRRIRDVINVFHYLRQRRKSSTPSPMQLDTNYINLKNSVIKLERRLLKELGFCVHVKHPHKIIVVYLQVLGMESNQDLVQTAWNYMNDSLRSTVFVRYTPETIACACIYLAARVLRVPLPNQPHWFYLFNATEEDLQQICISILRVYHHKKVSFEDMDAKVELCRKAIQEEKMKLKEAAAAAANSAQSPNTAADNETSPKKPPNVMPHMSSVPAEKRSASHARLDDQKKESYSSNKSNRPRSSSNPHYSKPPKARSRSPSHKHTRHKGSRPQALDRDLPKSYRSLDSHDSKESQSRDKSRSKNRHSSKRSHSRSRGAGNEVKKSRHDRSSDSSSPQHSSDGRSRKSYHKKHGKRRK